jgi:hypothetical protein
MSRVVFPSSKVAHKGVDVFEFLFTQCGIKVMNCGGDGSAQQYARLPKGTKPCKRCDKSRSRFTT